MDYSDWEEAMDKVMGTNKDMEETDIKEIGMETVIKETYMETVMETVTETDMETGMETVIKETGMEVMGVMIPTSMKTIIMEGKLNKQQHFLNTLNH